MLRWLRRSILRDYDVVQSRDLTGVWRSARVRLWRCNYDFYIEGEQVPHLPNGHSTYSIDTGVGWHVNINNGRVCGWSDKPIHGTIVDVWGRPLSATARRGRWW